MTMTRFEVIESKSWKRDDGATASIYGAVPWTSPTEEKRWKVVTRGYTVRDNERGTIGVGRKPWDTRAEAQAWVDKETARLEEARRAHEARYPKKTPAQLQREVDEALAKKRPRQKRSHAAMKGSGNGPSILRVSRGKTFAGQRSITAEVQYPDEPPSRVEFVGPSSGSGPVVMITRPSGIQTFVTDPSRFGDFGTAWVRRFFG